MPRLSDGQIEQARNVTLLEYLLRCEPGSVKQSTAGRHVHKTHDSFVIDNGKGEWFWNSKGIGGHSAIDYLERVEGMDFVSAVKHLTGENVPLPGQGKTKTYTAKTAAPPQERPPPKPKQLTLPKANNGNEMAAAYLMGRGISKATVWKCVNAGLLYESVNKSCVFVGKDGGVAKYACERSITGDGKKDVFGSDKKYGFSLPPDDPGKYGTTLIAFESPIDLLAHRDIMKMAGKDWDGHRLSLGGVSSAALDSFLERNPQISHVYLCLDSDKAGQDAAKRIAKGLLSGKRTGGIKITIAPPPIGKDFADTLQGILKLQRDKQRENPQERTGRQTQAAL